MKRLIVFIAIISCVGCTTLRPIEGTSTELQGRISSGQLLKAGDRVLIVTKDNKTHRFAITEMGAGRIVGKADCVPVDHVVSLERRQFSRAKTLILIGGFALLVGVVVYAAANVAPAFAL